jgi:hypothetical protein
MTITNSLRYRIYCADPSCATFLGPAGHITNPDANITYAVCEGTDCGKITCVTCKKLLPNGIEGHVCEVQEDERKFRETAKEQGYQECASCGHIVELAEACNHITCKCGHSFCYVCGKDWRGVHGCPQYGKATYDEEGFNQDGFHRDTGLDREGLTREQQMRRHHGHEHDDGEDDDREDDDDGEPDDWDVLQHVDEEFRAFIDTLPPGERQETLEATRIQLMEERGIVFDNPRHDQQDDGEEEEEEDDDDDDERADENLNRNNADENGPDAENLAEGLAENNGDGGDWDADDNGPGHRDDRGEGNSEDNDADAEDNGNAEDEDIIKADAENVIDPQASRPEEAGESGIEGLLDAGDEERHLLVTEHNLLNNDIQAVPAADHDSTGQVNAGAWNQVNWVEALVPTGGVGNTRLGFAPAEAMAAVNLNEAQTPAWPNYNPDDINTVDEDWMSVDRNTDDPQVNGYSDDYWNNVSARQFHEQNSSISSTTQTPNAEVDDADGIPDDPAPDSRVPEVPVESELSGVPGTPAVSEVAGVPNMDLNAFLDARLAFGF